MGRSTLSSQGRSLLNPRFDHESCGVGFVATLRGRSNHDILRLALTALGRLAHRGAVAADRKSSDGVGILCAVPRAFLLKQSGITLPMEQPLAVGMLFLPKEEVRCGPRCSTIPGMHLRPRAAMARMAGCSHPAKGFG